MSNALKWLLAILIGLVKSIISFIAIVGTWVMVWRWLEKPKSKENK